MPLPTKRKYPTVVLSGYILLEKDGKLLMMRRFNTGYQDGKYGLPAGHLEEREFATAGTIREVIEEVGITLKPKDIVIAHIAHRVCTDHARIDFFFKPTKWSGTPRNVEPHRCDDVAWFPINKLPRNTVPHVRASLKSYLAGNSFSEQTETNNKVLTK